MKRVMAGRDHLVTGVDSTPGIRPNRPAISERMKISSLLYHNDIECPICGLVLLSTSQIEWDHFMPLALGGAHDDTNIRAVHKACHRIKTSGTKATSYGSDIHAIAKCKRIASGGKKRHGPKIKSRPFPRRAKKG